MEIVRLPKRHDVYIGRPSEFGNPYRIGRDGTREEVIPKFEAYARRNKKLLTKIAELPHDAVLGCYCPTLPCHGEVIIKLWKEIHHATP